jgi:nucleotide-binding universal stress UspA family protein
MEGSQRQVAQQAFAPEALPYLREQGKLLATGSKSVDTVHITAPSVAEGLLQIEKAHDIDLVVVALGVHSETNHMRFGRVADSLIRSGSTPVLVIPPDADALVQPFVLRHVLVTLDGSTLSEQALGLLMGLLAQLKEQGGETPAVTLLTVAEDYAIMPDYQSYLDALCGALSPLPAFAQTPLDTKVIVGSASGAIVGVIEHGMRDDERGERGEAITSQPIDLLIMTTHGRGGLSRWLLGSVAGYVLPRVHIPVLLNRPGAPAPRS